MRLVARLKTIEEAAKLSQMGIDAFLLDTKLSTKKIANYNLDDLDGIIRRLSKTKKAIYVLVNKMIHEQDLQDLDILMRYLKTVPIQGILASDMTVYVVAKEYGLDHLIIYQPGTYNTNTYDLAYFNDLKIKGITLSKEITLAEIEKIANKEHHIELSLIGHGYLDMFYSKRKLLTNYARHKHLNKVELKDNYLLRLEEEIRKDEFYPILEDDAGTHIFRSKKLWSFSEFSELTEIIDEMFIERIFLDDEEYYEAIKAYKNEALRPDFIAKYASEYDSNFYYLYTEKLKGENNED